MSLEIRVLRLLLCLLANSAGATRTLTSHAKPAVARTIAVTFYDGSTLPSSLVPLDASSTSTLSLSAAPTPGSHAYVGLCSGDQNFEL